MIAASWPSDAATLGQPVIVENTAGAGGTIGVGRVARAGAGRLHAHASAIGRTNVAQRRHLPVSVRPAEGLRAGRADRHQPFLIVSRKTMPANNLEGIDRVAEGQSRTRPRRANSRHRQPEPCRGHLFQTAIGARFQLVPYRSGGPLDAGPGGRQHRHHARHAGDLAAAAAWRQHQGLCGHRQEPLARRARDSDHRRGRRARLLLLVLARALGAQGHAEGRSLPGSTTPSCKALADPAMRAEASSISRRTSSRASSRRLRRSHAFQKAEIEKWWPIIKAAGIKAQ